MNPSDVVLSGEDGERIPSAGVELLVLHASQGVNGFDSSCQTWAWTLVLRHRSSKNSRNTQIPSANATGFHLQLVSYLSMAETKRDRNTVSNPCQ